MEKIAHAGLKPDDALFKRSNRVHRPNPNHSRQFILSRAPDLHRKAQHLEKQYGHQDSHIAVAADEVFHDLNHVVSSWVLCRRPEVVSRLGDVEIGDRRTTDEPPMTNHRRRFYSIEILRKSLKSLSILPVPSTTLHSGSSAIETGSPVSSRIRWSRLLNKAPPPVSTMPRSLESADTTCGVRSQATRIAFMMVDTHSLSVSRISPSSTVIVLGTP